MAPSRLGAMLFFVANALWLAASRVAREAPAQSIEDILDELQRTRDSFVNLLESLRASAKIAEGTFTRDELIAIAQKDIAAIDAILLRYGRKPNAGRGGSSR